MSEAILTAVCHWVIYWWLNRSGPLWFHRHSRILNAVIATSGALSAFGLLLQLPLVWQYLPEGAVTHWFRGGLIVWSVVVVGTTIAFALVNATASRLVKNTHQPGRRQFLTAAKSVLIAAPAAVTGFGVFIERRNLQLVTENISIPGLHKDLNGLLITQVSDIHLSPFLSEKELAYAIDLANSTKPDLMMVTGDLITRRGDPLDACIRQLGRLRGNLGVWGCNGNHEVYAKCEEYVEEQCGRHGITMLRHTATTLQRGAGRINLAGVDYQTSSKPMLTSAGELLDPDPETFNMLLSHNPSAFPEAANQGWDFTLAGHTHGGQVSFEILHEHMNIARFYTPYTYGQYAIGDKKIFVTRGIGTVGLPARIGAPPEVAAIRLWCA